MPSRSESGLPLFASKNLAQAVREAKWPVLEKAQERVEAGQTEYGSPAVNFGTIATILSVLGFSYKGLPVRKEDIPSIMIVLKLAREANGSSKLDNWVDIAGYAACAGALFDDFSI